MALFTKTTRTRRERLQIEATERRSISGATSTTTRNNIGTHMNDTYSSDYQNASQNTPTVEAPNSTIVDTAERTA
jgi:RecJ-like exonuclease